MTKHVMQHDCNALHALNDAMQKNIVKYAFLANI